MMVRRIVAAAIKHKGMVCFVKRPGRHYHVIRKMAASGIPIPITGTQGFVTSDGLFVDRVTAMKIALEAEQLLPKSCNGVPYTQENRQLFSEDLW